MANEEDDKTVAIAQDFEAFLSDDEKRHRGTPPEILFHLTTSETAVKIITTDTIRASDSSTMNDPSEVIYGRGVAMKWLRSRKEPTAFQSLLLEFLETGRPPRHFAMPANGFRQRTFVTCFCSQTEKAETRARGIDTASAWLNYGRSGTGAAVGYFPKGLRPLVDPFHRIALIGVDYDAESQVERIAAFVAKGDAALKAAKASGDRWTELAAHMAAAILPRLTVQMKHPAFVTEDEWRLIYSEFLDNTLQRRSPALQTFTRYEAEGRTIPYVELKLAPEAVAGVLLGYSSRANAFDIFERLPERLQLGRLENSVRRSEVPVRP
jgi:hypothetical protein